MFKFKGISSSDMQVIIQDEELFKARAAQRIDAIEIDGRDGAIFNEYGYSYVERPICVQCLNPRRIDDILAWLNGVGELEYDGRVTTARFYNELEPERAASIKIIDTQFIRDPFWNKVNDQYEVVLDTIVNEGNMISRPLIKLEKCINSTIDITINGTRLKYNFNNDEYVEIDCDKKSVMYEGINRFRNIEIGYDFPKLNAGSNTIIVNSGDATIKVKKKDRWL